MIFYRIKDELRLICTIMSNDILYEFPAYESSEI